MFKGKAREVGAETKRLDQELDHAGAGETVSDIAAKSDAFVDANKPFLSDAKKRVKEAYCGSYALHMNVAYPAEAPPQEVASYERKSSWAILVGLILLLAEILFAYWATKAVLSLEELAALAVSIVATLVFFAIWKGVINYSVSGAGTERAQLQRSEAIWAITSLICIVLAVLVLVVLRTDFEFSESLWGALSVGLSLMLPAASASAFVVSNLSAWSTKLSGEWFALDRLEKGMVALQAKARLSLGHSAVRLLASVLILGFSSFPVYGGDRSIMAWIDPKIARNRQALEGMVGVGTKLTETAGDLTWEFRRLGRDPLAESSQGSVKMLGPQSPACQPTGEWIVKKSVRRRHQVACIEKHKLQFKQEFESVVTKLASVPPSRCVGIDGVLGNLNSTKTPQFHVFVVGNAALCDGVAAKVAQSMGHLLYVLVVSGGTDADNSVYRALQRYRWRYRESPSIRIMPMQEFPREFSGSTTEAGGQ